VVGTKGESLTRCRESILRYRLSLLCEYTVESRQHDQRQQRGADEPPDDDDSEWTLDFRSDAVGQREGNQPEHRDQRRHQDRAQSEQASSHDRFAVREAFTAKLIDIRDEDDAVQDRDPEEIDESDGRRHAQIFSGDPKRDDASDQREGKIQNDEGCMADGIE
jgi:hypothetical protein